MKKSAVKYVQDVLAITNLLRYSLADGLQHAYDSFHANLRVHLAKPPFEITDIGPYMQHLRDVQLMWFEVYQNFNVRPPVRYQPDRHQPDHYQPVGYQQRQPPTRPMKALPAPPPHFNTTNRPNAYLAEAEPDPVTAVYFTDCTGQDYEYDDEADAYVAANA